MNPESRALPTAINATMDNRRQPVSTCAICGGHRFRYLFSVADHRLVRCAECNFTLLNPQPSDDELAAISARDRAVGGSEGAKLDTAETHLDAVASYSGFTGGKLLEVGCGIGSLLPAAARRGFTVTGVETSTQACEKTRHAIAALGLQAEIICGEIAALANRPGEFDVCVIVDVIAHVRKPGQFIHALRRLLRPGGILLVATPSLDSGSSQVTTAGRAEFRPEHLSYFSRKSLESLLFSRGFRTLTWRADADGMVVMGRADTVASRPLLSMIIPVFNEAATFRTAFARLLAHPFPSIDVEYIIVESNSSDGTRDIVNEYASHPKVRVLLEDRPRGKGHAVRTGLRASRGDFVAIQDADLEYDVDDYDALLEPLLAYREAFVLGARHGGRSRKMRQFAGQPLTSGFLNFGHWFFTTLLNVCLGVRLKDPFTMYKLFRRDCIHDLTFEANRFDFDWELVIKLIRKGYVPIEIPVNYRSRSFHEGKKVRVIRDPLSWLVALAKFRFQPLHRPTSPPATVTSTHR